MQDKQQIHCIHLTPHTVVVHCSSIQLQNLCVNAVLQ